jgi:hypothetical protein
MANILINDLNVPGFDLLSGEETYLNEINDNELNFNSGGLPFLVSAASLLMAVKSAYEISKIAREVHDKNKGVIAWL